MKSQLKQTCPDCGSDMTRRTFVKAMGGAALAATAAPVFTSLPPAVSAPTADSAAETAVGRFYASLSEQQKSEICFPFNHQLRSRISANWHVTKQVVGDNFYSDDQRELIDEILKRITSSDGYERLLRQMDEDDGGVEAYSVAVFGQPGTGKFQWEMTGRHLTLRADGNSVDKAAFGGPIVYGHGEASPKDNLFHYQTKKVNEVFSALDVKQSEMALLKSAPGESAVKIQGEAGRFPGIAVQQLSADQKQLVEETIKVLLAPYRQEDVEEAIEILKTGGGFDALHMAFYQQGDLRNDKVWDIWRIEGPSFVWHFRGAPHVHAYINIGLVDESST